MKYTVTHSRKVRTRAYESLEIGFYREFDEVTFPDVAFELVRDKVEEWIEKELDRLLKEAVPRPEAQE